MLVCFVDCVVLVLVIGVSFFFVCVSGVVCLRVALFACWLCVVLGVLCVWFDACGLCCCLS